MALFQPAQLDEEIHFLFKTKKTEKTTKKFGNQKKMYYLCIVNEKKRYENSKK